MRTRGYAPIGILLALAFVGITSSRGLAAESCGRVISYFRRSPQGWQWRIFNPLNGRDTLYLHVNEMPSSVIWDSSLARTTFQVERDIFRADWKLGAVPRRVAQLPPFSRVCDWWFQPDSLCWVLYTSHPTGRSLPSDSTQTLCRTELWRSSRDGMTWRMALADSEVCIENDCETSAPKSSLTKRAAGVSAGDTPSWSPNWEELEPDSGGWAGSRYYIPSKTDPRRWGSFGSSPA